MPVSPTATDGWRRWTPRSEQQPCIRPADNGLHPDGKPDDGPLATDRPHTAKAFLYYRLKWKGMETDLGVTQSAFQGTPISSCLPVVGTSSACQWMEQRGNFVQLSRAPNGDIVKGDVVKDARTDPFINTDLSFHHIIRCMKASAWTSKPTSAISSISALRPSTTSSRFPPTW
jgi:hypothetical protein